LEKKDVVEKIEKLDINDKNETKNTTSISSNVIIENNTDEQDKEPKK
jgi:hypothetical protein